MLAEAIARAPGVPAPGPDVALDDAFLQNPYPVYRQWREAGAAALERRFLPGRLGAQPARGRRARVLRDPRFSSQRTGGWVKRIEGGMPATPGAAPTRGWTASSICSRARWSS
ncbi:hypothetical protein [Thauera humireducens]|uniref:hypothetical protein n=1 Tax=Thauera humireducens TaxID=1134435 RepID=UPI00311E7150